MLLMLKMLAYLLVAMAMMLLSAFCIGFAAQKFQQDGVTFLFLFVCCVSGIFAFTCGFLFHEGLHCETGQGGEHGNG